MLFMKITGQAYLNACQKNYAGRLEFGEKPHSFWCPASTLTHAYETTLSFANGCVLGHCTCPAKIVCKHLAKAVDLDALKLRLIDSHNLTRAQQLRDAALSAGDTDFANQIDTRIGELSQRSEAHKALQLEIYQLRDCPVVPPSIGRAARDTQSLAA